MDVSHDMMPRVTQPDPAQQVYYAFGYGGNGVSFSAHAGRRLAQRLMGQDGLKWDLPIYDSPLPGHLFAPFRRLGQSLLYRWYYLRDEMLKTGPAGSGRRPHAVAAHHSARRAMPGSICSSRIEVKPIRRKLRGALASSMKNTLPGSITTPSASAASASSAASSQGGPSSQQNEDPVMGAARKSGRWRSARQLGARVLLRLAPQQRMVVAQRDEQREGALDVGGRMAQHQPAQRAQLDRQLGRGDDVADAQARREGLGQTAYVDDAALAVQALERRHRLGAPAAFALEIVLDDHVSAAGQGSRLSRRSRDSVTDVGH